MISTFQSLYVIYIFVLGAVLCNAQDASFEQVDGNATCVSEYLFPMFPECKDFEDIVQEKRRELLEKGELREEECQEYMNPEECVKSQLFYARRQIVSLPPLECMQPVAEFLLGDLVDYVYDAALEDAETGTSNQLHDYRQI